MKVWKHTKKSRTLVYPRFVTFLMDIVYTVFYAKVYKHSYNNTFQDFAENTICVLSE